MSFSASRARFLRGRFSSQPSTRRPPWAQLEHEFVDRCNRCGDCITACVRGLLTRGSGGFPEMNSTRGDCDRCGDCARACRQEAFTYASGRTPWQLRAVILPACLVRRRVVCRSCGERCEAGAIHFRFARGGMSEPQVNGDACTGCGACQAVCPVRAIALHEKSTPQEACA